MPAGPAWEEGARPGTAIVSVDGRPAARLEPSEFPLSAEREAVILTPSGAEVAIRATFTPIGQGQTRFTLWLIAGMFAILGSAVIFRRPDLPTSRMFAAFAGAAAVALSVAPSSGGPAPPWALMLQVISLVAFGASFLVFTVTLTRDVRRRLYGLVTPVVAAIGSIIVIAYLLSVLVDPNLFEFVRPIEFLFISACVIWAIVMLAAAAFRGSDVHGREQARIVLWGTMVSALPFIVLTLVPEAAGGNTIVPEHISALSIVLMPVFFAYAILQHQLLGIRRLVHRGMVYGGATLALFAVIAGVLALALPFAGQGEGMGYSPLAVAAALVVGVLLFQPMRRATRWVVDRFVYGGVVDYDTVIGAVGEDLVESVDVEDVAGGIADRLARALNLESALMFLGPDSQQSELVAAMGERAADIRANLVPRLDSFVRQSEDRTLSEFQWESDSFMVATLRQSGQYMGYLLLGPKRGGEVFIAEEKELVASIAPILALTLDKSQLSEELRALNQLLTKAQEEERARIATDLHDGPLQKAMLISTGSMGPAVDETDLAKQMILEIREICSRLRPAILDDPGLIPRSNGFWKG